MNNSSAVSVSPRIQKIVAGNAGPFTGAGTNTYLVGERALAVIDPGPDEAAHQAATVRLAAGRPVTHILLTHAHRDHVDGLARLKALTGAITVGFGRGHAARPGSVETADSPSGGDYADWAFIPDMTVADGVIFQAGDMTFEAIHTPGHAPDHLCFALHGAEPVLLSGDHVMGWSTSVIAPPEGHMGDYLRSLERLTARPEALYLPGHGDAIPDGARTARAYLLHRQMRENSVVQAIRGGAGSSREIAAIVYAGLDPKLLTAARLSVEAHVELLVEKGLVRNNSGVLHAA
jgi:glyoxylase-like metal-dependent hydrolase (beta-lactamase superfamily II)